MPKCSRCGKGQTKLNDGDLCKVCYEKKNGPLQNQDVDEDESDDFMTQMGNLLDKKLEAQETKITNNMEDLLDKKLKAQEEKIKKAVLHEVTQQLNKINERQKKIEDANKKILQENKALQQRVSTLETRQKNTESDNQKMRNVINLQQGYIIQQDKLVRQKRLLISGLSESDTLTHESESAEDDAQKLELILKLFNVSMSKVISFKRVGSPDRGPDNRPRYLLIELVDVETRKEIKDNCSILKTIETLKHLYIKADLSKKDREEYSRLFKLKEKLEKDNPSKSITYNKGKIYMENEVVDEFKTSSKIF